MAESPAHVLGQIIGEQLEAALRIPLRKLARELNLFLDYKHSRSTRGGKSTVSWVDGKGNKHDLDYVFEKGGSDKRIGDPKAFIECAWRRYTKHSRNKAQEIEGAIGHLRIKYADQQPILAVVLGGEFTEPSLQQLRSHNFIVLHFSHADVIAAFAKLGVNVGTEQVTPQADIQMKVDAWNALSDERRKALPNELRKIGKDSIRVFLDDLRTALTRKIESIRVSAIYTGRAFEVISVEAAFEAIDGIDETIGDGEFSLVQIEVKYSNGSEIRCTFKTKYEAKEFLRRTA
jgi:hypothetical protein